MITNCKTFKVTRMRMIVTSTTNPTTTGVSSTVEGGTPILEYYNLSSSIDPKNNNSQDGITTDIVLTDTHPPEANRPQNITVPPPPLQSNLTEAMSVVSKLSVQSMPLRAL